MILNKENNFEYPFSDKELIIICEALTAQEKKLTSQLALFKTPSYTTSKISRELYNELLQVKELLFKVEDSISTEFLIIVQKNAKTSTNQINAFFNPS
jgi:hypothetical protein